jgi:branched-chain amino acid aminotransferase
MSNNIFAFFGGRMVPEERAKISIKIHALNYGTCAFEGMKAFYLGNGRWNLYRLDDHVSRLLRTCEHLYIESPVSHDEISETIKKLVLRNAFPKDTYVRPMIYCSHEGIGLAKRSAAEFAIFCQPIRKNKLRELNATFSRVVRIPPAAVPSVGKITGMYVNSYIAQREVAERGGQIALMKDINGNVTEAFGMNLCMVRKGRCITSPLSVGVLDGITRRSIIEFCKRDLGIKVEERLYTPRSLYTADEIFLCGTGAGINAIISVDGRKIGLGKCGDVTNLLSQFYRSVTRAQQAGYEKWYNIVSKD